MMIVKYFTASDIPKEFKRMLPSVPRARDFYISRMALRKALEEISCDFKDIELTELEIENHNTLSKWDTIKTSLGHTKNFAAAIISDDPEVASLGIDIELVSRPIKEGISKYFAHSFDGQSDPLELWVLKEACFKAAWPLFQKDKSAPLVLKDLWVNKDRFGIFESRVPIGRISLNYIDLFDEKFIVATAVIKRV